MLAACPSLVAVNLQRGSRLACSGQATRDRCRPATRRAISDATATTSIVCLARRARLAIALAAARGATESIFAGLTPPFALVVAAEWPEALGLGRVPDQARRACVLTLACLCGASRGFGWCVAHLGREPELVSCRIVKSCDSLCFPRVYLDHFHVAAQALGATCDR